MTYAIAAAGTGGHVFPGLAIAEALERAGVLRSDIAFFGGSRFEAQAVPAAGYDFVEVELRGLKRSLALANLTIPRTVWSAARQMAQHIRLRDVHALVATGGYVTVPAGWAAKRCRIPFFVQEQNAHAGLANRIMGRFAEETFTSFPVTDGLPDALYSGNPLRTMFVDFDRAELRQAALDHYGLDPALPTLGVVGGSLGAGILNQTVSDMVQAWDGPPMQIVHLVGTIHESAMAEQSNPHNLPWKVVAFEPAMELFFAVSDLVLARAGGMVAEITATGTPAILVPGEFGSKGHQAASADFVSRSGGALVVEQDNVARVATEIASLIEDPTRLAEMSAASSAVGRPQAANVIAARMIEAHGMRKT